MAKEEVQKEAPKEDIYYLPTLGKSVKATSMEEAIKKAKGEQ